MFKNTFKNFFLPIFLMGAGALASLRPGPLGFELLPEYLFPALTLVFLVAACMLALYFNSLRLTLLGFLLLFSIGVVIFRPLAPADHRLSWLVDHLLVSYNYLLPLLAVAVHFTRETDVFTEPAAIQFFTLGLFLLFLWPGLLSIIGIRLHTLLFRKLVWELSFGGLRLEVPGVSVVVILSLISVFAWRLERSFYVHNQFLIFWIFMGASVAFTPVAGWSLARTDGLASPGHLFMSFASLLMLVVCLAFAWNKAYLDPLTQVRGRMALDEKLERLSGKYSLAMVDIDNFKNFNDTYGHDSGDRVLRQVARTLENYSSGQVYRFGGEEFTLVYSGAVVEDVESEVERLRKLIADQKVGVTRKSKRASKILWKRVTVSVGLSDSAGKFDGAQEVLNAADNALFKAKDEGRNRVEVKK